MHIFNKKKKWKEYFEFSNIPIFSFVNRLIQSITIIYTHTTTTYWTNAANLKWFFKSREGENQVN